MCLCLLFKCQHLRIAQSRRVFVELESRQAGSGSRAGEIDSRCSAASSSRVCPLLSCFLRCHKLSRCSSLAITKSWRTAAGSWSVSRSLIASNFAASIVDLQCSQSLCSQSLTIAYSHCCLIRRKRPRTTRRTTRRSKRSSKLAPSLVSCACWSTRSLLRAVALVFNKRLLFVYIAASLWRLLPLLW